MTSLSTKQCQAFTGPRDYKMDIIKTIIENKDSAAIAAISGKEAFILDETDSHIYSTIYQYFNKFNAVPEYGYLEKLFNKNNEPDIVEYLEQMREKKPISDTALPLIEDRLAEYSRKTANTLLTNTKNELKLASIDEISGNIETLITDLCNVQSNAKLRESKQGLLYGQSSIDAFERRLQKAKVQDSHFIGKFGIDRLDDALGGYTKHDMINIMGFTGQGKSQLLRFLAYQALLQGLNVVFVPLETSRDDTEDSFYVLHANNYELWGNKVPRITKNNIKSGRLAKDAENYLKDVVRHFNTAEDMGSLYIIQPQDSNYSMDTLMADLKTIHKTKMPVDVLVLDYISLLRPYSTAKYIDATMINQMHSRMRQEMLSFDGGNGFTYMGACQVNRKGYKDMLADKEHLYDMTAIGDYNSIERDSTVLLSVARTPEDENSRVSRIQNLKARDNKTASPFIINFDGATGLYFSAGTDDISDEDALQQLEELEID